MKNIEFYWHHGAKVAVFGENKGKHRENCLCFRCADFHPEPKDVAKNCPIARILFALCQSFDIVTPAWECKRFTFSSKESKQAHSPTPVADTLGRTISKESGIL